MSIDLLPATGRVERVNYATGMMLSADDFRAEQLYHRGRLAQVLRHAFGEGTLAGLAVEGKDGLGKAVVDDNYNLFVRPGLAIDHHGQLIEVTRDYSISLKRWVESNAERVSAAINGNTLIVDVVLSARDIGRAKTPSFAEGALDALDAVTASRLEDGFALELVARKTEPAPATPVNAATKPLEQVLQGWASIPTGHVPSHRKVLLARIRNCPVTLNGAVYTIARGQSLTISNDVRPFIFLGGRSSANATV